MRVTIKGITPSTISFNTIGITLRGDSRDLELYPESIARHIDIKNEDQLAELNSVKNAKLIDVDIEEEDIPQPPKITPERIGKPSKQTPKVPQVVNVPTVADDDGVEDVQAKSESVKEVVSEKVVKKSGGRGRPKGSKDKSPRSSAKVAKKIVKHIVKKSDSETPNTSKTAVNDASESEVVIMTTDGAKRGKMRRSAIKEDTDDGRMDASLKAMKKLEEEEAADRNLPDTPVDESKLDISEKMGNKAVIGTGDSGSKSVEMLNSIVPDAKQMKEKSITFIDDETDKADEKVKDVFVDKDEVDDDLDFLEY